VRRHVGPGSQFLFNLVAQLLPELACAVIGRNLIILLQGLQRVVLLGKHKLFPRISPEKSWEGSIGGGLLVIAVAVLVWYLTDLYGVNDLNLNALEWAGLGLTVVIFGTWGDLVESLFKRALGIKDSGSILPGHGGMLDRFDSSLLAIPAAVVYLYTLTLF